MSGPAEVRASSATGTSVMSTCSWACPGAGQPGVVPAAGATPWILPAPAPSCALSAPADAALRAR